MKEYTIVIHGSRRDDEVTGTLEYLTNYFGYTLEKGRSWQHEKGNKKINMQPKTVKALVTNINNALNNSAMNGYSSKWVELA